MNITVEELRGELCITPYEEREILEGIERDLDFSVSAELLGIIIDRRPIPTEYENVWSPFQRLVWAARNAYITGYAVALKEINDVITVTLDALQTREVAQTERLAR